MKKKRYSENDIDRLFRIADFGIRRSHKDELGKRIFETAEEELSEEELYVAAGGNKEPDEPAQAPRV